MNRELFPPPLGPNNMTVSPSPTFRFIPFNIGLPSTSTNRFFISRMAHLLTKLYYTFYTPDFNIQAVLFSVFTKANKSFKI